MGMQMEGPGPRAGAGGGAEPHCGGRVVRLL